MIVKRPVDADVLAFAVAGGWLKLSRMLTSCRSPLKAGGPFYNRPARVGGRAHARAGASPTRHLNGQRVHFPITRHPLRVL